MVRVLQQARIYRLVVVTRIDIIKQEDRGVRRKE